MQKINKIKKLILDLKVRHYAIQASRKVNRMQMLMLLKDDYEEAIEWAQKDINDTAMVFCSSLLEEDLKAVQGDLLTYDW